MLEIFVHICQHILNHHAHMHYLLTLTEYLFIWIFHIYRTTHSESNCLALLPANIMP